MIQRFFAIGKNPAIKIPFVFLLVCMPLLGGCGGSAPATAEETKIVMGTVARLTVRADEIAAQAALRDGMTVLVQTEADADGAAVAAMEQAAGTGAWTEISPALYETLVRAQEIARRSNGAFDITAGALTALWDAARAAKTLPSPAEVAAARACAGYDALGLDTVEEDGKTVYRARLLRAGMKIDRGALIKGLALDGIDRSWQASGIEDALADLGTSSILARGVNATGEPWQIGIRNPRGESAADMIAVMPLSDEVLSSSGDNERYFLYEGRRYHHLIDPRTGYPADTGLASVAVILPRVSEEMPAWQGHMGLLSDMLSTAIFVLGPEKGRALLADFPAALVILIGPDGQMLP
ncbi:FAD:protein FMN transferase [uncultured Selenomonas sp.]|uniref:FAD:protein FMN transferase n=1 Tax=uncultured Selenomonas sp. TaxID=159275 RepID=UPI0028D43C08|nr:FAD:protein FMN transferase [uncultured Selenomonas sp.]